MELRPQRVVLGSPAVSELISEFAGRVIDGPLVGMVIQAKAPKYDFAGGAYVFDRKDCVWRLLA
jgi:hypothetical protein